MLKAPKRLLTEFSSIQKGFAVSVSLPFNSYYLRKTKTNNNNKTLWAYLDTSKVKSAVPGVLSCRQPGVQLTEMGRRMPWASGGTCLTITLELLRKEGSRTDTGLSSLSLEPPLSHPQHRLREHSPLYTKAHHPHSLVSLFQNIPRLLKDSRSRLKKKKKSGTTKLGVSDDLGVGCLRGGTRGRCLSHISATSVFGSSHGGGSTLRGQIHVKRERLKLPSC